LRYKFYNAGHIHNKKVVYSRENRAMSLQIIQRHSAVFLSQHGFLLAFVCRDCSESSVKKW